MPSQPIPSLEEIRTIIADIEANDYGYIGEHIVERFRNRAGITGYRFTKAGGYSDRYPTPEKCASALFDYLTGSHTALKVSKGGRPSSTFSKRFSSDVR